MLDSQGCGNRQTGHALPSPQLSFLAGRSGNRHCRSTEAEKRLNLNAIMGFIEVKVKGRCLTQTMTVLRMAFSERRQYLYPFINDSKPERHRCLSERPC